MPVRSHATKKDRHGLVSIVASELVWIETGDADAPDVLVASEYAPAIAVDLPLAQHRMRVAALPFAIEDRTAQPLDELHVVLGPEVGARRYLAALVSRTQMAAWLAVLAAHRVTPRRIIPDATLLAEPEGDAGWAVRVEGERVLIRTREHEAFATSAGLFDALWSAAGRPAVQQVGPIWPVGFPDPVDRVDASSLSTRGRNLVDLNQTPHHAGAQRFAGPLKIAAGIIASAALAHTAILSLDTAFASGAAAQRREAAARVLSAVAPLVPPDSDPGAMLADMLPNGSAEAGTSRFLPLLSRMSASLQPVSNGVAMQALTYDAADGALQVKIEAADLPALERVAKSLMESGLNAQSGGATVGDGRAESAVTVRETPGANAAAGAP